jgi:hypothetical protein
LVIFSVTKVAETVRKYPAIYYHTEDLYRTLSDVNELMLADYNELFPILNTQPEIEVLVNPFVTAWQNDAMEQYISVKAGYIQR